MASTTTKTKTVLITGATRGIGLKLAEKYIKLGWNVIGAARDPTKADQVRYTCTCAGYVDVCKRWRLAIQS
jgi:NAD(P)-dependent dehydrogenase (short-subunit alcohol dehydrogenase family)